MKPYAVGDVVRQKTFSGDVRAVRVTARRADVKNGRPGFDGYAEGQGEKVWGYDAQVVDVFPVEPAPENVPCVNCGRADLPLHFNRRCGACGPIA